MRVFVSADIEGINGVVHAEHQDPRLGAEYQRARRWMTREVNALVEGLLAGGASEILVNDSHNTMRNIVVEELNPAAELISGSGKPLSMMQGIERGFDAAVFVGYHARAGMPGVLSHTIADPMVADVRYNGVSVGETGINAAVAGHFGVPLILVSGDQVLAAEVKELLGDVSTVAVKQAITRTSARCLPLAKSEAALRTTAEAALQRHRQRQDIQPWLPQAPIDVELKMMNSGYADAAARLPGVRRLDGKTLGLTAANGLDAFRFVYAMICLA